MINNQAKDMALAFKCVIKGAAKMTSQLQKISRAFDDLAPKCDNCMKEGISSSLILTFNDESKLVTRKCCCCLQEKIYNG